jgi:hypothetical protein
LGPIVRKSIFPAVPTGVGGLGTVQPPHRILLIAYYVVRWNAGIAPKYAVLMPSALLISALLAWLLSTLPGVSMLFGIKRQAVAQPAGTAGQ